MGIYVQKEEKFVWKERCFGKLLYLCNVITLNNDVYDSNYYQCSQS